VDGDLRAADPAGDEPGKGGLSDSGEPLSLPSPALSNRRGRRSGDPPGGGEAGSGRGGRSGKTPENGASGGSRREDLPITTATLADIYAGQGLTAQAIAIFEKVLEREPDNARARERLNALRSQHVANAPQ
jgi:hypothetical protein